MQFSAASCLSCRGGAGNRSSSMFGPNVIETLGPVLVTRLSHYLVPLCQTTVINSCAVYIASLHMGEMAYLTDNVDGLNLTFIGPCIVMYSYNESQRVALFIKFIS
jgi:hypothetical protein